MMRKMLTLKRFSRDVGELMNDAHVFYNETTKDGFSDDEDDRDCKSNVSSDGDTISNKRVRKLSTVSEPQCPWQQTQRGSRRKRKRKDVSIIIQQ